MAAFFLKMAISGRQIFQIEAFERIYEGLDGHHSRISAQRLGFGKERTT